MDSFSFTIPQNIKFRAGTLDLLPDLAKELGKSKGYIISGPHLNKIGMVAKCRHGKRMFYGNRRKPKYRYRCESDGRFQEK